jgi:DNA-directed RNA polymerase beta subunit
MFSGTTGEYFDTLICIVPAYYQRLQKFVLDNVGVVSSGITDPLTHQPISGSSHGGSYKNGEMEAWTQAAHGATFIMNEKLRLDSDMNTIYICRTCKNKAIYNKFYNIYKCNVCGPRADIVEIPCTHSAHLLQEELNTSNVDLKYYTEPIVIHK